MKKDKIIMWMDKDGKYYGCHVLVGYKLSFGKTVDDCGQVVEPEVYKDAKEAKNVAKEIAKNSDLSCAILKSTRYKSAINGSIKDEVLEVSSVVIGKNEKLIARQNILNSQVVKEMA